MAMEIVTKSFESWGGALHIYSTTIDDDSLEADMWTTHVPETDIFGGSFKEIVDLKRETHDLEKIVSEGKTEDEYYKQLIVSDVYGGDNNFDEPYAYIDDTQDESNYIIDDSDIDILGGSDYIDNNVKKDSLKVVIKSLKTMLKTITV